MPSSKNERQVAILRYSLLKGLSIQEEFSKLQKLFQKKNNTLTWVKIRIQSDCSIIINQIINHAVVFSELSNQYSYPDHFCECICMKKYIMYCMCAFSTQRAHSFHQIKSHTITLFLIFWWIPIMCSLCENIKVPPFPGWQMSM